MGRHNTISTNDNTDTNLRMDLITIDARASSNHTETHTQLDFIIDKSSHNNIFSHPNIRDNHTITFFCKKSV